MPRAEVVTELEGLRQRHGGVLRPEDVVDFARDPSTALHARFTWDDTEAARRYRLVQAGEVIRLVISVYAEETKVHRIRAFVSLPSDRATGGGYRSTREVMNDEVRRAEMLRAALAIFQSARLRYAHLKELAGVWDAVREVEETIEVAPPSSAAG